MRELKVDVSRETRDQLETLALTLGRWQKTINLVGHSTMEETWTRHILDSAQLLPLVPRAAQRILDLGSGAGFPGLVLAALRPDTHVTLIEADARKAAFLGEAARRMGLAPQPKVIAQRIEAIPPIECDVITARALAPLTKLLTLANPHRSNRTICLFHKGSGWQAELEQAHKDWEVSCQPFSSATDRDAVLLRISSYSAKGLRDR